MTRRVLILLTAAAAALAVPAAPRAAVDKLAVFEHLPVLERGRVMPMDTYARNILLRFSGKSSYQRRPASAWIAQALFEPSAAAEEPVFLVNNPDVLQAVGFDVTKRDRYSFRQLLPYRAKLRDLA